MSLLLIQPHYLPFACKTATMKANTIPDSIGMIMVPVLVPVLPIVSFLEVVGLLLWSFLSKKGKNVLKIIFYLENYGVE